MPVARVDGLRWREYQGEVPPQPKVHRMSAASDSLNNRSFGAPATGWAPARETGMKPTEPIPLRQTRTRRTVDLSPAQHRGLDLWQRDAADRVGCARITGQEVMTALIDQLLADPELSAQIIRTLRSRR